jgi:hypothetical protein
MNLFGIGVAENFVSMITFCDRNIPQFVAALEEKSSISDKIIPKIKSP